MSDFFISGYSESGFAPVSQPSPLDLRVSDFMRLAQLELAKFEFGLQDRTQGRKSRAAADIETALAHAGKLSHPRARQRAHSYYPVEGREHCPHCWVFVGEKRALRVSRGNGNGVASCASCESQYELSPS